MAPYEASAPCTSEEQLGQTRERFADDDPDFVQLKTKLLQQAGITMGARLGSGTFSVVLRAVWGDRHPVAIKIIDTRDGGDYVRRFLPRERSLVLPLQHFHIVRVWAVVPEGPFVTFVSELCEGGDLLQKILNLTRIPEHHSKGMFRQLVAALEYLQSLQVNHRDLKCENIFLDRNDNIKLGDFGFARVMRPGDISNTFCGSRAYVAPEVLSAQAYTGYATDIWSAGIVLFVMVTGLMPFDDRDPRRMLKKQVTHAVRFPRNVHLSADVKLLVMDMLHPVPASRPDCAAINACDWLHGVELSRRTDPIDATH